MGHAPLQITWRILASLASLNIVNMVAKVMPMYGMNSNTGGQLRGHEEKVRREKAERVTLSPTTFRLENLLGNPLPWLR